MCVLYMQSHVLAVESRMIVSVVHVICIYLPMTFVLFQKWKLMSLDEMQSECVCCYDACIHTLGLACRLLICPVLPILLMWPCPVVTDHSRQIIA